MLCDGPAIFFANAVAPAACPFNRCEVSRAIASSLITSLISSSWVHPLSLHYELRSARAIVAAFVVIFPSTCVGSELLDFNRDVRPILSADCYHCHGADAAQRQAELRLDAQGNGFESGTIVPGKPDESVLVWRIRSRDPDEQMPAPDSHRALAPEEIETLVQWVREGATYDKHCAFKAVERPTLPSANRDERRQNEQSFYAQKDPRRRLDAFAASAAPDAKRRFVVRQLSFTAVPDFAAS